MSTIFLTDSVFANSISSATGAVLEYVIPAESLQALELLKARGARLGLIVLAPDQPRKGLKKALVSSGLLDLFDPDLITYGDGFTQPVLVDAAVRARKIPGHNYFVAEHCHERALALSAGFDTAIPHPSLVLEVMGGGTLVYVRVSNLDGDENQARFKRFLTLPVLPLYRTFEKTGSTFIITTKGSAEFTQTLGFDVEIFPDEHDPQTTDLYLVQNLGSSEFPPDKRSIGFLAQNNLARFVLTITNHDVVLALPPDVSIEQVHFLNPNHGHNRRLVANPFLLTMQSDQPNNSSLQSNVDIRRAEELSAAEIGELKDRIIPARLELFHTRYTGRAPLSPSAPPIRSRHALHDDNEPVTRTLCDHLDELGRGVMKPAQRLNFSYQGKRLSNIVAEIPGSQPDSCVIISAHFDSTAALDLDYHPERDPAPGADDDASGIAAVLAAVDTAVRLRAAGQLKQTLRFILFNAEEVGLIGSQVYVRQMPDNVTVTAVFQMDEIGYTGGSPQSEFEVHIGVRGKPETESGSMVLARTIGTVVSQVSRVLRRPQVYTTATFDPLDQHSDHTPFQILGHAACAVTEDSHRGPLDTSPAHRENRDHHHATDRDIDYSYAAEIARVVTAAAILTAKR